MAIPMNPSIVAMVFGAEQLVLTSATLAGLK
jgi:hypothetical protein